MQDSIGGNQKQYRGASRRLVWSLFLVLLCILLILWWQFASGGILQKGVSPSQVSIRESDGRIQWQYLDGEWQDIASVASLKGEDGTDGRDGTDGKDGADGQDGADGTPGATGVTGAVGATGATGATGSAGATGATGADGADGATGANGVDGTNGTNGREIEIQKGTLYIQWRYVGDITWNNVVAYTDLKGDKGDKGDTGATGATGSIGATGPANSLAIGTVSKTACTPTASISGTAPSQTLNLGLPGLPNGGAAGQVLTKNSATDCDASWKDTNELRGAGMPNGTVTANVGTYYTDTAATNGAIRWVKASGTGNTGWQVIYGDTGWRDLTSYMVAQGTFGGSTGHVVKWRQVNSMIEVYIKITGTTLSASSWLPFTATSPPAEARPTHDILMQVSGNTGQNGRFWLRPSGQIVYTGNALDLSYFTGASVTWESSAWPTSLPGTATTAPN